MCRVGSQGISINDLNAVFLFHTDATKKMTIQRLGRALRHSKNKKRAQVFDFILLKNDGTDIKESDQKRKDWLTSLSKVK